MAFSKASTDEVLSAQLSFIEEAYLKTRDYLFKAPGASSADSAAAFDLAVDRIAKLNDVFSNLNLSALDVDSIDCATFAHTTTGTATVTISAAAPFGGVVVDLDSSDPTKATIPATATVLEGDTTVDVTVTGVAAGSTTLGASIGSDDPVTVDVTVS